MENEFTMSQYASKDDLIAAMRERIEDLEDTVQFCERWAVHHGSKPSLSAKEALSAIQHYPGITEVTDSYADGKRPNTFNPYARIAQLEAQVKQLQRVPLSDDVRRKVFDDLYPHGALPRTFETFKIISRAIEAAHGITQEKQG